MTKGRILVATLVVLVLAAVGWQASSEGEATAQAKQQTQQQVQQQSRQVSPEPGADADRGGSAVSALKNPAPEEPAPEEPARATQTRRLAVENVLQVGGYGCASCQDVVEGILQESRGVEEATYEAETDTYLVKVNDEFRMDEVAARIRSISKEYNRRLGLPDSPPWVLKEA